MSDDPHQLISTLSLVVGHLRLARDAIVESGEMITLAQIDTLLGVALEESEREMAKLRIELTRG